MLRLQCEESYKSEKVAGLPLRWRSRLLRVYDKKMADAYTLPAGRGLVTQAVQSATCELITTTDLFAKLRIPLNISDHDLCARADEFANLTLDAGRMQVDVWYVRYAMANYVAGCGIEPPPNTVKHRGAILRMTCRYWWRRNLRKLHANVLERTAISMGFVNRSMDLYVSNESLSRRLQQNRRNRLMMENTKLENEHGQRYTIAELAATGTANKAIRRGELMTRISGFETIARELQHVGLFLTITCPSRMHKFSDLGKGKVIPNANYDGTTPKEAQAYLCKTFTRIRAKLARRDCGVYGFRIAEPHHDACPHWHLLLFTTSEKEAEVSAIFKAYALKDSPGERGSETHRFKCVQIDWGRGTAAGYIAKYVSKNIDGLHVESDLYGNPALETSARVEAWASTWGIRQFQQIGGAPVGVWRELRRIKAIPPGAPEHLKNAHAATNKGGTNEEPSQASWSEYVKAQGGCFCGRKALIQLAKEPSNDTGRYGDEMQPRPCGVETVGAETYRFGIVPDMRRMVHWFVSSIRFRWQRVVAESSIRFGVGLLHSAQDRLTIMLDLSRGAGDRGSARTADAAPRFSALSAPLASFSP